MFSSIILFRLVLLNKKGIKFKLKIQLQLNLNKVKSLTRGKLEEILKGYFM